MTSASLDWLWATVGVLIALGGLLLLAWALLRDRARGRERCPRCWYDMKGAEARASSRCPTCGRGPRALVCPECGHDARSVERLGKTRRRWRWAGVALVLLVMAWPTSVGPRIARDGWWRLLPTWVLVAMEPGAPLVWLDEPESYQIEQSGMMKELLRRVNRGESGVAWRWCVRQAYEPDGRWGISAKDQAALDRLEVRPRAAGYRGTLEGVSQVVASEAGVPLVADWSAVRDATWFSDWEELPTWTIQGEDTLRGVLDDAVFNQTDPIGAVAWTLRGGAVVVLESEAARELTTVVAYDVADILEAASTEDELWPPQGAGYPFERSFQFNALDVLLDSLEFEVLPYTWVDNGGSLGVVCQSGGTLYIRHIAPGHAGVQERLTIIREGLGVPAR